MAKKKYKARTGSAFRKKDAQKIGETLERIRNGQGHLTTKDILDEAQKKNSFLHQYFEWDNSEASKQYRLDQARHLINHVVEITIVAGEQVEQRSYFSVNEKNKGKIYVTLKEATENPDFKKQLLNKIIVSLENLTVTMKLFGES